MRRYHAPDPWLILSTLFLLVFGLIMVSSASVVESFQATGSNTHYFFKQAIFGVVGLVIWFFLQRIDYHKYKTLATAGLITALVLLVAVFIPGLGYSLGGSKRWIGAGELTLQVTEPLKLCLILYLAYWFERKDYKISGFYSTFLPFVLILLVIGGLVMAEPDLGTMLVVMSIAVGMYFYAGANIKHLITLGITGILAIFTLIKIEPYRAARLLTFLNPGSDPMGAGYHITQALIALGSGGLFGLGFGHSRQKFNFLPEASSDSIFAIIGEELGLLGAVALVVLPLTIFVWRGWVIAKKAPDIFGRLLALGITLWIGYQTAINLGAITGLIPLTGVPLPFISQGGTSLVSVMIGAGILLNISRQTVYTKEDEDPFSWWWNLRTHFAGSVGRVDHKKRKSES